MKDFLYLGSQSSSRKKLLTDAGIPFVIAAHSSDENIERNNLSFDQYVIKIAQEKMQHVILNEPRDNYILTADTLVRIASSEIILGKPKNREDAKNMLRAMHNKEVEVVTGCCLRKQNNQKIIAEKSWATGALIEFSIDEEYLDIYFEKEPNVLKAAGSCIVDTGYGLSFFKNIKGSYSAVIGLPLFELRQELKKMNFSF